MPTLFWMATLPLLVGFSDDDARPETASPATLRPLVPAYFYPEGAGEKEWDRLIATGQRTELVVIVNPASGPGRRVNPRYTAIFERLATTRIVPIGYVTTSYGRRPTAEVKAEVDRWLHFYPDIQGIFFDEQASDAAHVEAQAELYQYVKQTKRLDLVVTNPGTVCDASYLSRPAADVVCLFESPRKPESLRLPDWTQTFAARRIAALPYQVADVAAMRACVEEARKRGIGILYVTDADGRNPWNRLPSYWEDEVAAMMVTPVGNR